jgi:hypothetical protein
LRNRLVEIIGEQWNSQQIGCGAPIVGARGFGAQIGPVFNVAVAAA